ncbi:hypothetical protein OF83DRAFT_273721 [Amylostereum chailletii]|nr:hypothetical protein OF83DRAFT_273721 [Amylostereum chailletii]
MSLVKLPILFASAILTWRALTPMSVASRPSEGDIPQGGGTEGLIGRFVPQLARILKFALGCLLEAVYILECHEIVKTPFSRIHHSLCSSDVDVGVTGVFIVGVSLIACGALLRVACYRTLGTLFTLKLMLRKEHRLITAGPYAYIRHPSYTALLCIFMGTGLVAFGPGSLTMEHGWLRTSPGRVYLFVWLLLRGLSSVNLVGRTIYEDGFLKEKFGKEWEIWARTTPYRLLPWVY